MLIYGANETSLVPLGLGINLSHEDALPVETLKEHVFLTQPLVLSQHAIVAIGNERG